MSAKIYGPNGTELEIGALNKAARVELYHSNGSPVYPVAPVGKYGMRIEIIPTNLTINNVQWTIFNPVGNATIVGLDRIQLQSGFIGTTAASISYFRFEKFSAATTFTGGIVSPAAKFKITYPVSNIICNQLPAGLTPPTPAPVFEQYFHEHAVRNSTSLSDTVGIEIAGGGAEDELLYLEPGTGLAITADSALVLGAVLVGSVYWHEYAI